MRTFLLEREDILLGYDAVSILYPSVPPLSHWRAWEYAAYQKHQLSGRILDLGCGDGRYFNLIWPQAHDVIGIDVDPVVAQLASFSGIYNEVHVTTACQLPLPDHSIDHVFANCSLEHMADLEEVLAEIYRCLRPGGTLLCSVVTNRFIEWSLLPHLFTLAGYDQAATNLKREFLSYHNLVNPLTVTEWEQKLNGAGFVSELHTPILPKFNSGFFLLMDSLWHVKRVQGGEIGDNIFKLLSANLSFPPAFRNVIAGLLDMEQDWLDCSGAVFLARKPA